MTTDSSACAFACRLLLFGCYVRGIHSLRLLSELDTPSFLVDLQALQQQAAGASSAKNVPISPIYLPRSKRKLVPRPMDSKSTAHVFNENGVAVDALNCHGVCYLHARVTQPREGGNDSLFLAALDLPANMQAHLVLGLNNHHVISYYWARSAGAGGAMEAPGVLLDTSSASLRWESEEGFTKCNSNDGKRSEWVNFLRPGDQIQLLPHDPESALNRMLEEFDSRRVYGISSAGRPLGSEPAVVCEWSI